MRAGRTAACALVYCRWRETSERVEEIEQERARDGIERLECRLGQRALTLCAVIASLMVKARPS